MNEILRALLAVMVNPKESVIDYFKILEIAKTAIDSLNQLPNVVVLDDSLKTFVIGDIHGHVVLPQISQEIGLTDSEGNFNEDIDFQLLFMGDMVDRGNCSFETLLFCVLLTLKYPGKVFCLRGNHETAEIASIYGLYTEMERKMGNTSYFEQVLEIFKVLPIAAIYQENFFVHGGPPFEPLETGDGRPLTIDEINAIERRVTNVNESESHALLQMLWNDPEYSFRPSYRGAGFTFTDKNTTAFLKVNGLKCVYRAHQVAPEGHRIDQTAIQDAPQESAPKDSICVTIFSAPNYCNYAGNKGSIALFTDNEVSYISYTAPESSRIKFDHHTEESVFDDAPTRMPSGTEI